MAEIGRDQSALEILTESLKSMIDPDHGLLTELRSRGALNKEETLEVQAQSTYIKRNQKILEYILNKHKCEEFCLALRNSDQTHVANYIEAKGVYSDQYRRNWPLTEQYLSLLDANERILVDLLDPDSGLLTSLFSAQIINDRQKETVNSFPTRHKRNEALLELLRLRTIDNYQKTIQCLRETNQSHIADILEQGGVVLAIRAVMSGNVENVDAVEQNLSSTISSLLRETIPNASAEQIRRVLDKVQLSLIDTDKGHSIMLYFYCRLMKDLEQLEYLVQSEQINWIIKELFVIVLPSIAEVQVMTSLSDCDLKRARNYFQDHKSFNKEIALIKEEIPFDRRISNTSITELPFPVLDVILQHCYLHLILRQNRRTQQDEDIIKLLACVDIHWFRRITSRLFKKAVRHRLSSYYRLKFRISMVYANHREFIQENLQVAGLIKALELSDCISDLKSETIRKRMCSLTKRKSSKNKSWKHCDVVTLIDEVRHKSHDAFIRCLHLTKQKRMAKVIENGGAVIKAEIRILSAVNKAEWTRSFVKRLNNLKDKSKFKPQATETLIDQLKDNGIEILNAVEDRDVVVWIWCRSQNAFDELKQMKEYQDLADIFYQLNTGEP